MNSTKLIYAIAIILIVSTISSCSSEKVISSSLIQKRKYMKGFNIENRNNFNQNIQITDANSSLEKKSTNSSNQNFNEPIIADNNLKDELFTESINKYGNLLQKRKNDDKCDEIVLRNGDILSVKVEEVGVNEIKYKKCTNLSGPTYSVLKDNVFLIKYANGDKDVFKLETKEEVKKEAYFPKNSEVLPGSEDDVDNSKKYSGIGIASLVIGLFAYSVFLYLSILVGIAMSVLAIVFGLISMNSKRMGKGFGIAGFILGIIAAVAIGILFIASTK
ncbi:MAG: DUF308 domain-containing protein [Bacteroidetes bacterium]|nr:DUF308 domain-containing protein [Bacteroidota bacterium]